MSELFVSSPEDLGQVILVEDELKGVPDRWHLYRAVK
jgi:hypothetical protein